MDLVESPGISTRFTEWVHQLTIRGESMHSRVPVAIRYYDLVRVWVDLDPRWPIDRIAAECRCVGSSFVHG